MKAITRSFLSKILGDLTEAGKGKAMKVDARHLTMHDMLPPHWREEADTREEWFIKVCRAYGLHATYMMIEDKFTVRLTEDEADEATITWPRAVRDNA
jgi:hypothetical protein